MTPSFRQVQMRPSVSYSSVASGNQTSLSSITNNEDVIKSLQQQVAILTKKQSKKFVYSGKAYYTPDKIKDAAVINDLSFCIGTMIFKRFKFLSNKNDLYNYERKGSIGYVMMSEKCLNITEDNKEEFWFKYARKVSSIITEKRSSSRTCMKKGFIGKLRTNSIMITNITCINYKFDYVISDIYKGQNTSFKSLIDNNEDIHMFQENITTLFSYEFDELIDNSKHTLHFLFTEHFFKAVVGIKVWKKEITKKKISDIMTVSDEALVYLIYENNRYVWMKQIETNNYKKCDVKPKYTAERGGNVLNNGWTREGIIRYNTYVKFVKCERKLIARKEYEDKYLAYKKGTKVIQDIDTNTKQTEELELIVPYADSSTDEESGNDVSDQEEDLQTSDAEKEQEEAEVQEESDEIEDTLDNLNGNKNNGPINHDYEADRSQDKPSKKRSAPKTSLTRNGGNPIRPTRPRRS